MRRFVRPWVQAACRAPWEAAKVALAADPGGLGRPEPPNLQLPASECGAIARGRSQTAQADRRSGCGQSEGPAHGAGLSDLLDPFHLERTEPDRRASAAGTAVCGEGFVS